MSELMRTESAADQTAQMEQWFVDFAFGARDDLGRLPDITLDRIQQLFGAEVPLRGALHQLSGMLFALPGSEDDFSGDAALYIYGYPDEDIVRASGYEIGALTAKIAGYLGLNEAGTHPQRLQPELQCKHPPQPAKIARPAVRQTVIKPAPSPVADVVHIMSPEEYDRRAHHISLGPSVFDEYFISNSENEQWQDRALCAQTDPEAFFPEKGGSTREAKRICQGCEVKADCLEYAMTGEERFGIWGGLSERERRRLKRGIS